MNIKRLMNQTKVIFKDEYLDNVNLQQCLDERGCVHTELRFENCKIKALDASYTVFTQPVTLINCQIETLHCEVAYFTAGFLMADCQIEQEVSFECGGHNEAGSDFVLKNCIFAGYVNFFDVWFGGKVLITNNLFKKGTNMREHLAVPYGVAKESMLQITRNQFTSIES